MENGTDQVMSHTNVMFDVDQTIVDLAGAIDYLREHGWTQGKNFNARGDCCAWGAVLASVSKDTARGLTYLPEPQRDRTSNVARAFQRLNGIDIVTYNDAEGRTKNQVLRTLESTLSVLKDKPSLLTAKRGDDQ